MLSVSTQLAQSDDIQLFKRMLASVSFANEILIYNMQRHDLSSLKKSKKIKIINIQTPQIVEEIRTRQITEARGDWVLVMDYDEELTSHARDEISALMQSSGACSAYALPRDNYSLGMALKHGGWERDFVVRLVRRVDFVHWPTNIHSTPRVKGCTVTLNHGLVHHKDASLAQMVAKTNRYSDAEAKLFFDGGLPPVTTLTLLRKPLMEFIRRYLLKRGFLDGRIGLIQSLYQAYSTFISYAKLYELQSLNNSPRQSDE